MLLATTAFVWLTSCGDSSADSAATSPTTAITAALSPSTPASTSSTLSVVPESTSPATTAPAPEAQLSVVGLGDSIPGALGCNAPCESYVELLGGLAATTLGKTVEATNLATNDSLTSDGLLYRIKKNDVHRRRSPTLTSSRSKSDSMTGRGRVRGGAMRNAPRVVPRR